MAAGNFLERTYTGKTSTEKADIETVKIHTNHIISSPSDKCCALNINNMYLNTVESTQEYMRIHITIIPDNIMMIMSTPKDLSISKLPRPFTD